MATIITCSLKTWIGFSPEFGYFSAKLSRMVRVHPVRAMSRSHYNIKEIVFERPIYLYICTAAALFLFIRYKCLT